MRNVKQQAAIFFPRSRCGFASTVACGDVLSRGRKGQPGVTRAGLQALVRTTPDVDVVDRPVRTAEMVEAVVTEAKAELHGLTGLTLQVDDGVQIRLRVAAPYLAVRERIAEAGADGVVIRIGL